MGAKTLTSRRSFCAADAPAAETETVHSSETGMMLNMTRQSSREMNNVARDTGRLFSGCPVVVG